MIDKKKQTRTYDKRFVHKPSDRQALSFFDAERHEWVAEPGEFKAIVAASSDDVRGEVSL